MRGLDIFAGAGGGSWGARLANVEMVGAVDMCPIATATYRENFPKAHIETNRLEAVDLTALKRQVGEVDILLASPECTNHSPAKGARPRDELSRATAMLVTEYARFFRPRWLVLENVVQMRPWSRYPELKNDLMALGYNLAEQFLDAVDFGVPQTRRRLFLVGDRGRRPQIVNRKRPGRKRSAKSVLDFPGRWATSDLYHPRRAPDTLDRARRAIASLGHDASFLLVYYGGDKRGSKNGGWQPLSRPLRTITTLDRFALVQPSSQGPQMRMLQVSELTRGMGFPQGYTLPVGNRRDKIRLLGNAVCPPVMEAVVRALVRDDIST